jgi:hypothetical protein
LREGAIERNPLQHARPLVAEAAIFSGWYLVPTLAEHDGAAAESARSTQPAHGRIVFPISAGIAARGDLRKIRNSRNPAVGEQHTHAVVRVDEIDTEDIGPYQTAHKPVDVIDEIATPYGEHDVGQGGRRH